MPSANSSKRVVARGPWWCCWLSLINQVTGPITMSGAQVRTLPTSKPGHGPFNCVQEEMVLWDSSSGGASKDDAKSLPSLVGEEATVRLPTTNDDDSFPKPHSDP